MTTNFKDTSFRITEYKVLIYRLLLAYLMYQISRLLFYIYNHDMIVVGSIFEYLKLAFYGMKFDTVSIIYTNVLFILLSVLPFFVNTNRVYQKVLFWIYFISNGIAVSSNFVDFIYYKYILGRTTIEAFDSIKNEQNASHLLLEFAMSYWHVLVLFILTMMLWVYLYKLVKINEVKQKLNLKYILISIPVLLITVAASIYGIRGDFKKSTRPINILDASRKVTNKTQSSLVLNTPFAFIRTLGVNTFVEKKYMDKSRMNALIQPIKKYESTEATTHPNIVIFILESFSKEYIGAVNKETNIPDYKSFTPFLDSLSNHSMVFSNAYANGYKSIHGMSSVLAGIPSFENAFTSSTYVQQPITSLVSVLNSEGYDTSFFHGAPNGSMGFLGFSNILGIQNYYGMKEFNDDTQFDGFWGIWDEPFFQFMNTTLTQKKQPFLSVLFSVSSHSPYIVPEKYKDKFPKGYNKIHQTIGYSDHALRAFFNAAKKEAWYKNTIFVFTGDHANLIHYNEYQKVMNWHTVPIIIFQPNVNQYELHTELAQQIDIYPTLLQMIHYKKPFRSWGRSLIDTTSNPFVIRHTNHFYQYMQDGYVLTFDGKKSVGLFNESDRDLENNIIQTHPKETAKIEEECKAFIQVYMNSIVNRELK